MTLSKKYRLVFFIFVTMVGVNIGLAWLVFHYDGIWQIMLLPVLVATIFAIQYFKLWRRTLAAEGRYMLKLIQFGKNYATRQRVELLKASIIKSSEEKDHGKKET